MSPANVVLLLSVLLAHSGPKTDSTRAAEDANAPVTASGAFGAAILLRGDQLFVGGPGAVVDLFPMPANRPGAVHVFRRSGSGWTLETTVSVPETLVGDAFGSALDVDGDVMVVGAPGGNGGTGLVYVFQRDGAGWRQAARLSAPGATAGDAFGAAVGVEGSNILVGAPGRGAGGGAVVAFRREGSAWRAAQTLELPADSVQGRFGASLDIGVGRAVVGAPGTGFALLPTMPAAPKPGAVHLLRESGGTWTFESAARSRSATPELLGWDVELVGDDVWASAPFAEQMRGAVRIYSRSGSGPLTERASLTRPGGPAGAGFGYAFAQTGDQALVGAPMAQSVTIFARGADGAWTETRTVQSSAPFSFFGSAVAASGADAIVGLPGADLFEGRAGAYAFSGGAWTEAGTVLVETAPLDAIVGAEATCDGTGEVAGFDCSAVDLVSFLPVGSIGGVRGSFTNDTWGWTDPETGIEYAIVGRDRGTSFISLADPTAPRYLGDLPLTEGATPNLWRDMKVYRDHVFVVADGAGPHGMQVFDLRRLRDVRNPPAVFQEVAHYSGFTSAHNIAINEASGFAYLLGSSGDSCGGALHMVDIRDPLNPSFAGCFGDPSTGLAGTGYTHDAQCVIYAGPDTEHRGKEICFNSSENALGIADVSDKSSPKVISSGAIPVSAYIHQGWLSDDHRYFYVNDEGDEIAGMTPRTRTLIWDIEDLDDPVLAAEHLGTTASSDHNLYVNGRFMYQSNYVSGLRVLDVSDPVHPVEVGYFDTVPWGLDAPGFAGSWSNYPFFESGVIVVTSMREGVFFLRKSTPPIL